MIKDEFCGLTNYSLPQVNHIKINGRTAEELVPLTLFWTASGFEVNVKARELWVEIEADYDTQEPWFTVLINGSVISRQMAYRGRHKVCLFRNRNPDEIKNVRFVKDSQAMHDDPYCCLQIHGFWTDGTFCPVEYRPYKIEFIGDSITSGEGIFGNEKENDWVSMLFSAVQNYAYIAAEKLNADLRIISQSGWGLFASWDGVLEHAVPSCYEKICRLLEGEKNAALGALSDYDFAKWQPDAVVINLGTNDNSAFARPDFKHSMSEFEEAAVAFLKTVRRCNPRAKIVWVYGMLGYNMTLPIVHAIDSYISETGDKNVSYLQLVNTTEKTVGSRAHPGVECHKLAADIITDFLKSTGAFDRT